MRSSRIFIVAAIIAAVAAIHQSLAQDAPVPPSPAAEAVAPPVDPGEADAQIEAHEQLDRAHEQLEIQLQKAEEAIESLRGNEARSLRQQIEKARAQADRQLREVGREIELAQAAVGPPSDDLAPPGPAIAVREQLHRIVGRAPAKALVIRFDNADPAVQANLEEDLNVMSRVLERSVVQRLGEEDGPKASGIQVFFSPDGGATRNLYLEGYGSLFLMNVRFPLLPPANKSEPEKPKQDTDSSWEDAKRELSGERDPWNIAKTFRYDFGGGEFQEYDAEKVERLRQSLLESLKSASNIRGLKSDEWIAITVLGGPSQGPVKPKPMRRAGPDRPGPKRPDARDEAVVADMRDGQPGSPRGSVMTLRVKKSDVDDFAKGRLDLDQFKKKVSITTYAANTGGWSSHGMF